MQAGYILISSFERNTSVAFFSNADDAREQMIHEFYENFNDDDIANFDAELESDTAWGNGRNGDYDWCIKPNFVSDDLIQSLSKAV